MSFMNKEVNRRRPCPICGKTDYCSFWNSPEKGFERVVCKRTEGTDGEDIMGVDGNLYTFIHTSLGGNGVFEIKSVYEARREQEKDEWMRANQVGPYNPRNKNYKEKATKPNNIVKAAVVTHEYHEENHIEPLPHPQRHRIYQCLLKHLTLDPIHKASLMKDGWSEDMLEKHMICSFPAKDIVRFKYKNFNTSNPYRKALAKTVMDELGLSDLTGVPGAYQDAQSNWTFNGPSGIVFPLYDKDGWIYGLNIRMDFMDVSVALNREGERRFYIHAGQKYYHEPMKGFYTLSGKEKVFPKHQGYYDGTGKYHEIKGKYRPFTSYAEDEAAYREYIIRNKFKNGCRLESSMSLYYTPKEDNCYFCFLTEGAKKAIFANCYMKAPVVGFQGVDAWGDLLKGEKGHRPIDSLKKYGVTTFIVVYDADKMVNSSVLKAESRVVTALQAEGFKMGVGAWDIHEGKGLDDLLANGGQPGIAFY